MTKTPKPRSAPAGFALAGGLHDSRSFKRGLDAARKHYAAVDAGECAEHPLPGNPYRKPTRAQEARHELRPWHAWNRGWNHGVPA